MTDRDRLSPADADIQHDTVKALARIIAEALETLGSRSEDPADLLPLLRARLNREPRGPRSSDEPRPEGLAAS
jgi:hypothetical protein